MSSQIEEARQHAVSARQFGKLAVFLSGIAVVGFFAATYGLTSGRFREWGGYLSVLFVAAAGCFILSIAAATASYLLYRKCIGEWAAIPKQHDESDLLLESAKKWSSHGILSPWMAALGGLLSVASIFFYVVTSGGHGRPLRRGRRRIIASMSPGDGWCGDGPKPNALEIASEQRRRDADSWLRDALVEHSSIASFSHLALELMREGAPPDLIAGCHAAALDEIRHARTAFTFAAAYAGKSHEPGPFPGADRSRFRNPFLGRGARLAEIAEESFIDGCIGEESAAYSLALIGSRSSDPIIQSSLSQMAEEEHRHAELAWQIVEWAFRNCEESRRLRLRRVFEGSLRAAANGSIPDEMIQGWRFRLAQVTKRSLTVDQGEPILQR